MAATGTDGRVWMWALGLAVALGSTVAACGSGVVVDEGAASDATSTTVAAEEIEIPVEPPPEVVVTRRVIGDTRELRLHPAIGDVQSVELEQTTRQTVTEGLQRFETRTVIRAGQTFVVDRVLGDQFEYTSTFDTYEVVRAEGLPPAAIDDLDEVAEGFVGAQMNGRMDSRGRVVDLKMTAPVGLPDEIRPMFVQMVESLRNASALFPDEAVGVGATWVVETPLEMNGLDLGQRTTYELVDLGEDDYVLEGTIEQTTDRPGSIEMPGVPAGAVSIAEYSVGGTVTIRGSFSHIQPGTNTGTATASADFEVEARDGSEERFRQDVTVRSEQRAD